MPNRILPPGAYGGNVAETGTRDATQYSQTPDTVSTFSPTLPTFDPVQVGTQRAVDVVRSLFPWADELGLTGMLDNLIRGGSSAEEAYANVVKSPQYQAQFAGMIDASGVRRFANERQYLDTINDYRDVLKEFGALDPGRDKNLDYVNLIEQGIDPNELRQRFTVYRELEAGSQEGRDAFYVYAGMKVSVDDLYRATVDPGYGQQLTSEYDRAVMASPFDYQTFITRATEVGLARAADTLRAMQQRGMVTGQVVSRLLTTDPGFARQVMGALFAGAPTENGTALGLNELLTSFDLAVLASAATEQGLELPTRERVTQLRQAGVTRARALQAYGGFARSQNVLQGAAQRANLGQDFSLQMWEEAVLLGKGQAVGDLSRITATESNFGRPEGSFVQAMEGTRVTQTGRLGMR